MIYTLHVTEQQLRVVIVMIVAALTEQQLRVVIVMSVAALHTSIMEPRSLDSKRMLIGSP